MVNKFVSIIFLHVLLSSVSCEARELELEQPPGSDHLQNSISGPLGQPQFKYFMFVQTWPPSFCKTAHCDLQPGYFTIHGLWPQQAANPGRNRLTDAILDPRRTALLKYWPDLRTTNFTKSKSFWRYEYRTHGVFCTTKYSAEQYIVRALTLGESFKPFGWLAKKNIVPNAKKQYLRSDIVAAIRSSTSTTPDLQCQTKSGKSYLLEVRLCLDDKLEKFINCGGKVGSCGTHVYYPPAPAVSEI